MRKHIIPGLLLTTILGTYACYNHSYVNPSLAPETNASYSQWHSHWFFGLISTTADVELTTVCPQGVARIDNVHTFVNGLIGALIGVVYAPTTVKVYCSSGGSAHNVEVPNINESALRRLVEDEPEISEKLVKLREQTAISP
ncbi:MAG: Bor family protein [Myxococcales bacterium]|nr:Bor family protein [Myxococcales bacterium]